MTTAIGPGAGMPTEWSACVDQLAFGLNGLDPYTQGISWGTDFALKQRLFVMSAGNVPWQGWTQYPDIDRKSTRLNSSHLVISYAVFCLKKKKHEPSFSLSPAHLNHHHSLTLSHRFTLRYHT